MRNILLFWTICIISWFMACTDSDDLFYDESETQPIEVEAFVTRSFNDIQTKSKIDTVKPQDSLIFIAEIYPSKTIRNQKVYWTVDGKLFANEFSFKWYATKAGLTKAAFVFVDYFGDTLSDTVSIYVSSPPSLDTNNFIPADKSQNINPNQPVHFVWNSEDPDNLRELSNHFSLRDGANKENPTVEFIIDTTIQQNHLSLASGLKPLTKYTWFVDVSNDMQQTANQEISASFFTSGAKGENAILLSLYTSAGKSTQSCQITVDKVEGDTSIRFQDLAVSLTPEENEFYVRPLPAGKYKVIAKSNSHPDFRPDSATIQIQGDQVFLLDSLILVDKTAPKIRSTQSADTIEITPSPKFIIFDEGGSVQSNTIKVSLDGTAISETSFSRDTLTVELPIQESWTYRILTISAEDASGNMGRKHIYIKPNAFPPENIQ